MTIGVLGWFGARNPNQVASHLNSAHGKNYDDISANFKPYWRFQANATGWAFLDHQIPILHRHLSLVKPASLTSAINAISKIVAAPMMRVQTEHTYIVVPARVGLGNRCEVHPGHICTPIGGCGALYESYGRCIKHSFQHMAYDGQISCAALFTQRTRPSRGSQEGCQANLRRSVPITDTDSWNLTTMKPCLCVLKPHDLKPLASKARRSLRGVFANVETRCCDRHQSSGGNLANLSSVGFQSILRVQISCAALLFRTQPPSRGSQEGCQNSKAPLPNLSKKSTESVCEFAIRSAPHRRHLNLHDHRARPGVRGSCTLARRPTGSLVSTSPCPYAFSQKQKNL